jgi:hypothetical protein
MKGEFRLGCFEKFLSALSVPLVWRHDTQNNDTQYNHILNRATQNEGLISTLSINDTQHNDTQYNHIQNRATQNEGLIYTLSINDTQHY